MHSRVPMSSTNRVSWVRVAIETTPRAGSAFSPTSQSNLRCQPVEHNAPSSANSPTLIIDCHAQKRRDGAEA